MRAQLISREAPSGMQADSNTGLQHGHGHGVTCTANSSVDQIGERYGDIQVTT